MVRKRREAGGEGSLLDFLGAGEVRQTLSQEDSLLSFIKSKGGKVRKSELYNWAKGKGLPPAELYRSLSKLISEGKVVKRFDDESKELVYAVV